MAKQKKQKVSDEETDDIDSTVVGQKDIGSLVRKMENDYTSGPTQISKYVEFDQYETLNRIDAYLNSKHITGETDSMGREKPFFNIVTAAVNIWYRATDIDRKNIKLKATKAKMDVLVFLATVFLQEWMRKSKFGQFLNKWGRELAKYGTSVTKFVTKKGELIPTVIPWARLITDVINFYDNPVIEVFEFTPAQLRKNKSYDQVMVEKLVVAATARTDINKQRVDNKPGYIKVYEVHGEFPLSWLNDNDLDDDIYQQQIQTISFVVSEEDKDQYQDFILFRGKENNPYMKTDLIEEEDRVLSIGAVQNMFEAQWMVNHSSKAIKDQLDLASKLIFQTADKTFVGQNVLTAIENGDILVHEANMPLSSINNNAHDIASLQSFQSQWMVLGNQINNISDAMLGIRPRGQASAKLQQLQLQESYSLFELMTENKGLAIAEMMKQFVIPYIKRYKMATSEQINATLSSYDLNKIDARYIPNEAIRRHNKKSKEAVLRGEIPPAFDPKAAQQDVRNDLSQMGNQRFFAPSDIPETTWKEALKDFGDEVEIDITGEQTDTQMVMDALQKALQMFVQATPEQLADPNFKLIFNKILEQTAVISPIEIAATPPPQQQPSAKVTESLNYKDAPPDVQRQIEQQAGLQPSQQDQQPVVPAGPAAPVRKKVGIPSNK